VFIQGQNPSHSPERTEVMKGWFGWSESRSLKWSTLIGVTILKRSACVARVLTTAGFSNSERGSLGRGRALSDQSAIVYGDWWSALHRL
jgi:hypothetical protein